MKRYAVLVEGRFDFLYAKTANALLRYRAEEVVCCIDSDNAGKTTNEVINKYTVRHLIALRSLLGPIV